LQFAYARTSESSGGSRSWTWIRLSEGRLSEGRLSEGRLSEGRLSEWTNFVASHKVPLKEALAEKGACFLCSNVLVIVIEGLRGRRIWKKEIGTLAPLV
jgi:hypothetical protein